MFKVALLRPWKILFDLISFLVAIYLSVVYLLLYMLFTIYPIVFQEKRGWNSGVGELPLLGTVIGACRDTESLRRGVWLALLRAGIMRWAGLCVSWIKDDDR